jgi:hypothetical protein
MWWANEGMRWANEGMQGANEGIQGINEGIWRPNEGWNEWLKGCEDPKKEGMSDWRDEMSK